MKTWKREKLDKDLECTRALVWQAEWLRMTPAQKDFYQSLCDQIMSIDIPEYSKSSELVAYTGLRGYWGIKDE